MDIKVESSGSASPLVEAVWSSRSAGAGSFTSLAVSTSELVFTRERGTVGVMLRGPETRATVAQTPANAEFFGITFRQGVHLPALPPTALLDRHAALPTTGSTLWLHDHALPLPRIEDADLFVERLVRLGLLRSEPVVEAVLNNDVPSGPTSVRTVQRRFLRATGLSYRAVLAIERARRAAALLQSGTPIAEVVHTLGYTDQPHLTRALRQLIGRTPARIADAGWLHAPLGTGATEPH